MVDLHSEIISYKETLFWLSDVLFLVIKRYNFQKATAGNSRKMLDVSSSYGKDIPIFIISR